MTKDYNIPFFSIVIPAYNCEDTIKDTINSILSQSYQDFELIIVNDGSTDNTNEVIETMNSKKIKLITIANSGPGIARNKGIEESHGQYLIFIDADDKIHTNNLKDRYNLLKNESIDLLIGSYDTKVLNEGNSVEVKDTIAPEMYLSNQSDFLAQVYPLMERQLMYVIWNKVYNLSIVKDNSIQFPPYNSCEDRLFNLAYFKYVKTCKTTKKIIYNYSFEGKSSLTNKYFPNKFDTFVEFYMKSIQLVPEDRSGFAKLFLKGAMSSFTPLHNPDTPLSRKEKKEYIKVALNNDKLKEAAKISDANNLIQKIFKLIFNLPSTNLHYFVSWFIYKLSNMNPVLIERFKRKY